MLRCLRFLIAHPKDVLIVVLALLLLLLNWHVKVLKSERTAFQRDDIDMPEDAKQVVTVYRDRVITKWRTEPAKVVYRDRYVPPEGYVNINIKEKNLRRDAELQIKDWGFARRLGGGIVYSGKLMPQADIKWFYFRRYSFLVGITPEYGGVGVSRHLDDFTPFTNLELLGNAGASWEGRLRLGIGVRTNF